MDADLCSEGQPPSQTIRLTMFAVLVPPEPKLPTVVRWTRLSTTYIYQQKANHLLVIGEGVARDAATENACVI